MSDLSDAKHALWSVRVELEWNGNRYTVGRLTSFRPTGILPLTEHAPRSSPNASLLWQLDKTSRQISQFQRM